MGQQEVQNYLKKKNDFCSSKEIGECFKISQGNINTSLLKMFRANEIIRRKIKKDQYWIYEYKLK